MAKVRHNVIDALTDEQIDQLADIGAAILAQLDPAGAMAATYTRDDDESAPEAGDESGSDKRVRM